MFKAIIDVKLCIMKYTNKCININDENNNVKIIADVKEEEKEYILSKIDKILPMGIIFSHTFEDDELIVTLKQI